MRPLFNPFGKPFNEVKEKDLDVLKTVAEGWNVEYKREKLNGLKISKSIASFANSQGGIYFIGINSDPSTNFATDIVGVSNSPDVVRDAVNSNLQPFPFLETFSINLGNGGKVLMTIIPEGKNPPYINSDGRIYRRQGSASDPIAETNRITIDALYNKARKYEEEIENFRKCNLTFSKGEENVPFLEIYINPSPYNGNDIDILASDKMATILKKFNEPFEIKEEGEDGKVRFSITGNIEFDTINTYGKSVVLRRLKKQDLNYNGTSLEIDIFGNAKMLIPIGVGFHNSAAFNSELVKITSTKYLQDDLDTSIFDIKFIDGRSLFGVIIGLLKKYLDFILDNNYGENIEIKLRLINCWKTCLYFKSNNYLEFVKQFGLPICMKDEQYYPDNAFVLKIKEIEKEQLLVLFSFTAFALGVPSDVAIPSVIDDIQNVKSKDNKD